MAITLVGQGSYVAGIAGASLNPVAPSYQIGDCLLLSTSEFYGTDTISDPSGWTPLYDTGTAPNIYVWGRIAVTTSDTIPTVAWGGTAISWAVIDVFRGVDTSFTQTIASGSRGRNSSTTGDIIGPAGARTPTQNNCLIYFLGSHNKTSTSNGRTYSAPSGFTMLGSQAQSGSATSSGRCYSIQTTAAAIPANTGMSASVLDGSSSGFRGLFVSLPAAASGGGGGGGTGTVAFPPPKRKTYVYIDNYYPR